MANLRQEILFDLAPHEAFTLAGAGGHLLTCTRGGLWITVEGDAADVVLGPGDVLRIANRRPVVISALKNGSLSLRPDRPAKSPAAGAAVRMHRVIAAEGVFA